MEKTFTSTFAEKRIFIAGKFIGNVKYAVWYKRKYWFVNSNNKIIQTLDMKTSLLQDLNMRFENKELYVVEEQEVVLM